MNQKLVSRRTLTAIVLLSVIVICGLPYAAIFGLVVWAEYTKEALPRQSIESETLRQLPEAHDRFLILIDSFRQEVSGTSPDTLLKEEISEGSVYYGCMLFHAVFSFESKLESEYPFYDTKKMYYPIFKQAGFTGGWNSYRNEDNNMEVKFLSAYNDPFYQIELRYEEPELDACRG